MKLEVGMYVRGNGFIDKISSMSEDKTELFFQEKPIFSDGECIGYKWCYSKDILKASHNIIDLIEVGDYVNGMEITRISGTRYDDNDLHCYCEHNGDENWKRVMIPAKDIKSIVTKEQFEAMQYKVMN